MTEESTQENMASLPCPGLRLPWGMTVVRPLSFKGQEVESRFKNKTHWYHGQIISPSEQWPICHCSPKPTLEKASVKGQTEIILAKSSRTNWSLSDGCGKKAPCSLKSTNLSPLLKGLWDKCQQNQSLAPQCNTGKRITPNIQCLWMQLIALLGFNSTNIYLIIYFLASVGPGSI